MSLPRFFQSSLLLLVPGPFFSSWYLLVEGPEAHIVFPSLQGPLLRWLKVNFSEAFIAWIHIKALRVFVESVLRCVAGMLGWAALSGRPWRGTLDALSAPISLPCPPALCFLWLHLSKNE